MKQRVIVGEEFGDTEVTVGESAEKIKADIEKRESKTRDTLTIALLVIGGGFLIGSALIGLLDQTMDELQAVWNTVSWFMGGIFGYYFGTNNGNSNGQDP